MASIARHFINFNITISQFVDKLLPVRFRLNGNATFLAEAIPLVSTQGACLYDLGGGARPCITLEQKLRHRLFVVGVDLDEAELAAAPPGIYDRIIVADLTTFEGQADADVVVCQATLEHVKDGAAAFRAIASCVRPGGMVAIFSPCKNALFARVNRVMPERLKRRVLFALYPHKAAGHDGFPAYYDRCSPSQVEQLSRENGLEVVTRRLFWKSSYFYFLLPAYLFWRVYILIGILMIGDDAAETYYYVLKRSENAS